MGKCDKGATQKRARTSARPTQLVRTPVWPGQAEQEVRETPTRSCHDCMYCISDTLLWARTLLSGFPVLGLCVNHPDTPGQVREIPYSGPCRNFRAKRIEPPPPPSDEIRYIPLTRGMHAIVDTRNYEWLNRHKWCIQAARYGHTHYAVRRVGNRKIFMHREIMRPPPGMVVDHINRNGLDNREANLRNCTRLQNLQNRYWDAGQSKYRGVSPVGDKWQAVVGFHGETIYLGIFDDEVEAAKARDRKAYELAGEFAYLNFPDDFP